jgi:hypothetical protein
MSGQTFSIESLRVASPCQESWDEMRGTDEVRFCSHCSKSVHDVSRLTRAQAERLVALSRGGVCVRLVRRADKSVVVKESRASFGRVRRRVSFVASAMLAALLGLFTDARAQTPSTYKSKTCPDARVNVSRTRREGVSAQVERGTLKGTVIYPNGAAIPGARISLRKRDAKPEGKGARRKAKAEQVTRANAAVIAGPFVTTSDEGGFKFTSVEQGVYTLMVEASGFKRFEVENVTVRDGEDVSFDLTLPLNVEEVTVGIIMLPEFPNPNNNLAMPIDKAPLLGIGKPEE